MYLVPARSLLRCHSWANLWYTDTEVMEVDMARLLATTLSTWCGLVARDSSPCSSVTHLRWKEGGAVPRQFQSVSAILWTVLVLVVMIFK